MVAKFFVSGYVKIDGTTVYVYSDWNGNHDAVFTCKDISLAPYIAAAINGKGPITGATGYGSALGENTDAQLLIWDLWDDFLQELDQNGAAGMYSNWGSNGNNISGLTENNQKSKADQLKIEMKQYLDGEEGKKINHKAELLFLFSNTIVNGKRKWQRLMVTQGSIGNVNKVTIVKEWTNYSDIIKAGRIVKKIYVTLKYKDTQAGTGENVKGYENIEIPLDLKKNGYGSVEIYGIPEDGKTINDYEVVEGGKNNITFTLTTQLEGDADTGYTFKLTNTGKSVKFKAKKQWNDSETKYRPSSLTFYLVKYIDEYRNENKYNQCEDDIEYTKDNIYGVITLEDAKAKAEETSKNSKDEPDYFAIPKNVIISDGIVNVYELKKSDSKYVIKHYKYEYVETKEMSKEKWEADEYIEFDTSVQENFGAYTVIEKPVDRYSSVDGYSITFSLQNAKGDQNNNDTSTEYVVWTETTVINAEDSEGEVISTNYTNKNPGVFISGNVWLDKFGGKQSIQNGLKDEGESGIEGITVVWKDAIGTTIASTTTDKDGNYKMSIDPPIHKHPYWIDYVKYVLINLSYVQFEYNGVEYTTTLPSIITDLYNTNRSKQSSMAIEGLDERQALNNKFWDIRNGMASGNEGSVGIDYEVSGINSVTGTANATSAAAAEGLYYTGNKTIYEALPHLFEDGKLKVGFLENAEITRSKTPYCHKHCFWGIVEMKTIKENDGNESGYLFNPLYAALGKVLDHKFVNIKVSLKDSHILGYMINLLTLRVWWIGISFRLTTIYCNPIETLLKSSPPDLISTLISLVVGSHCRLEGLYTDENDIDQWTIKNVNCGLIEREQPDLAIESDVSTVEINMNGQDHTYCYANRKATVTPDYLKTFTDYVTGFVTKGAVKDVTSLLKYTNRPDYVREVNPSDVVYSKYYKDKYSQFSEDFKVYVTYSTKVYNQSSTIPAKVNSIINYFDNRYQEVVEVSARGNMEIATEIGESGVVASKYPESDIFGATIINLKEDAWIKPSLQIGGTDFADFVTIDVKYLVKPKTVAEDLFNDASVNLMHISEINSYASRYGLYTIYANGLPADGVGVLEDFIGQLTEAGGNSTMNNSNLLNGTITKLTSTLSDLYGKAVELFFGSLDAYQGNTDSGNASDKMEDAKNEVSNKVGSSIGTTILSFLTGQDAQKIRDNMRGAKNMMISNFNVLTSKVRDANGIYIVEYYSGFDKDSEPGDSIDFIKAINICAATIKNFDTEITDLVAQMWKSLSDSPQEILESVLKDTKNLEYLAKGDISGLLNNISKTVGDNVTSKINGTLGVVKGQANEVYEAMKWGIFKLLEDDTDIAPMMKLKLDSKYKTVSGFVWEDGQTQESKERNEREGDGIYDSNTEKKAANVRVSLYKVDDTTGTLTPAQLYIRKNDKNATITPSAVGGPTSGKVTINSNEIINVFDIISETDKYYVVNASTVTNTDGKYAFTGLIEDEYQVEFQYDKNATVVGTNHELDGRNYKSTIIKNEMVKQLFTEELNYSSNTDWHIQLANAGVKNTSVAADDMQLRCQYEKDLVNGNYYSEVTMAARTNKFKLQVEYVTVDQKSTKVKDNGEPENGEFKKNLGDVFNFGVVTRAKEDLSVDKTIENLTLTLANGQVLVDGNPYGNDTLNYTVALGSKDTTKVRGSNYAGRRVRTEVDTELLHGATLDIVYKITVRNDSEIDYKYDTDVQEGENIYTHNKYYYFGNRSDLDKPGHEIIDSTILEVIDYLDSDLTIVDDVDTLTGDWKIVSNIEDLKGTDNNGQLVSVGQNSVYEDLEKNRDKYTILKTEIFKDLKASLKEEERSREVKLHVSKLLGNQSEQYNYANGIEIVKIGGKIARSRIAKHDENYAPKYIPGNFVPSKNVGDEQDSDKIDYIITPPTGTQETLVYIITAVVGLIIVSVGVILIKKFVIQNK